MAPAVVLTCVAFNKERALTLFNIVKRCLPVLLIFLYLGAMILLLVTVAITLDKFSSQHRGQHELDSSFIMISSF